YRPSEAVPMTQSGPEPGGTWLLQNRAHAHFNNVYMLCPNVGPVYVHPAMEAPFGIPGGKSHMVDYRCTGMGRTGSGYNSFTAGMIDIEAVRHFRTMNLQCKWMKDLRAEVFRRMYEVPIHPANLWLDRAPAQHDEVDEVYRANIARLVERGSYAPPAVDYPGVRYIPAGSNSEQTDWSAGRDLWSQNGPK